MNELLNPYIAGAPVVETSMFFGREDVFHWIERSLAGKYVDHILVLHGQRRVGKTSVLKQIPNFLSEKYIQVFFDLQGRTGTTLDRFLWWLASEIVRTLKTKHDITFPKPDRKTFEDTEYLISEFVPSLRPSLSEKVLLLTFDEFDSLDRPEIHERLAQPLIAYLRRLIEFDHLNFIFSIGSSGDKLENMQASYTDFFKSALYRKISFLTHDDCHRLITKPVEGLIKYERKAVDKIFKISSGHPYFTQLICHELFSRCQKTGAREIYVEDVEGVLEDVIERGTVNLKFVWDEASDLEKWVLAALAQMEEHDYKKLAEMLERQRVRFSDSDLNSAIIHLRDKDVLTQDNQFVIRLMHMWLVANRPMDRVREELVEVNPIANRYIEIGDEYRDRQQYQEAIESYQQALNVDAGNLKAQASIGSVHMALGDYSEAVTAFNNALQIDDEDVVARTGYCDANLALGKEAQSRGEMEQALNFYQAILVINPAHTDARQHMASIYQERGEDLLHAGRDDEAIDAFKQAMVSTPEDDRLSARYEEVLAEKKSKVIRSWLGKADKALSRQRWDEAVEMVEEAIRVDPEDQDLQAKLLEVKDAPRQFKLDGYRREAEKALTRGNWDKAAAAIETAILLDPEDQSLVEWLDNIRKDQLSAQLNLYAQRIEKSIAAEEWDVAIQAVHNAIQLAPNDTSWQDKLEEIKKTRHQAQLDSLYAQAKESKENNEWDEAINLLEEYLKLEDREEIRDELESFREEKREYELTTYRSQAERATEVENWSEAEKAWSAYQKLEPEDADRIESKLSHARKYARISDEYNRAQLAMNKKRYGKAIELLQGIIAQDPTYKSTSRLLVEAVEANKAVTVWRRPWLYWVAGALTVVIVAVLFGPRLLRTFSAEPKESPIVEGFANETPIPEVPTATITPFSEEASPTLEVLDVVDSETPEVPEVSPSPTPDPRILNPDNQHLYRYIGSAYAKTQTNWIAARNYCEELGGYLATIQNAAEDEFVRELTTKNIWLGGTDEEQEGTWIWITGEPWEYTNWMSGEPDDESGKDYLIFSIYGQHWQASSLSTHWDFVCEWDPESDWDWGVEAGGSYAPFFEYIGAKPPTFEDDFSTSKIEWGLTSVGTSISDMRRDETLWVTSPGVTFPVNELFNATNFVMSFDFFPNKEESTGVLEVAFRASLNLDTYYKLKFSFSHLGIRDAWLFSQNNGTMIRTTDNGFVNLVDDYNQILFIVHEELLGVFVNEELVFEKTDLESWSDENFIIYPSGGSVSFDNFKFWNLDGVEFE